MMINSNGNSETKRIIPILYRLKYFRITGNRKKPMSNPAKMITGVVMPMYVGL